MANLIIQALQITLPEVYTDDAALGLYTVSGVSYLRWSEASLAGVAETWNSEILLKNGIGDITASSDLSRGGNIAQYSGTKILATNAESLKGSLDDLGINLIGLSANITEFIGTAADSDATSRTVVFTGIVEDVQWGETTLSISLKNSLYKRETNIGTVTSEGVTIPVTFGKHAPVYSKIVDGVETTTTDINNLAKFVRVSKEYTIIKNTDIYGGVTPTINAFPVIEVVNNLEYKVRYRNTGFGYFNYSDLQNTYMTVLDGTGSGQTRRVTNVDSCALIGIRTGDDVLFKITLSSYLETTLIDTDTGDGRSWVQLKTLSSEYEADKWACKSFNDSTGTAIATGAEIYTSSDLGFNSLPSFGYDIDVDNARKNSLKVNPELCEGNVDDLNSFKILPVTGISLFSGSILNLDESALFLKIADGLYARTDGGKYNFSGQVPTLTNTSNASDKDMSTFATYNLTDSVFNETSNACEYFNILDFELPEAPENFNFTDVYFMISAKSKLTPNAFNVLAGASIRLEIMDRRFYGTATALLLEDYQANYWDMDNESLIDNVPDFYPIVDRSSNNKYAYLAPSKETVAGVANKYKEMRSFKIFKMTCTDKNTYDTLKNVYLKLYRKFSNGGDNPGNNLEDYLNIYEVGIMFRKTASIENEIYSPLSGRIYNDTWGTRKTAINLIENPKDIIEHCARLKNWSEVNPTTPIGGDEMNTGKAYNPYALIKTSGSGSFDSTNLDYLATQTAKVCLQVTDKDKQTTTAITRKLCDSFGLCSYIDKDGNECLETTEPTSTSETISLADVIGGIGDVIEPQIENIYCEPVVNYLFNQGSGKYDRSASVTNIGAAAWQASYTPGYTLADGVIIWNTCKALYQKYRQIELCPSEFSDQSCIADYATMVNYVKRKLSWMDKQRLPTISLAYSKGKDYTIFQHLLVLLPTHTRNSTIECMIEKITKDKNSNLVKIDLVVLGTMETAWYDTSDSTNEKVDTADDANEAVIDV